MMYRQVKKQLASFKAEPQSGVESDPLAWWEDKQTRYPLLAAAARDLLGVPGSTAALERAFSNAGTIFGPKRARLDLFS